MRFLVIGVFICTVFSSSAQFTNTISLPTIVPPSPEVAQLGKVGALSAGLHTGSASASIPLFSFSVNKATVNIALSYNSNGIKIDDIPSRVGLGWNLVAGGVVSRIIHDEADGEKTFFPPIADMSTLNNNLLTYLKDASNPGLEYDTEWDEYSYSFNGMSGKFFLDDNGKGFCIPHNNFKVEVAGHNGNYKQIKITTGDGIQYFFGYPTREKTRSINISGGETGVINKSYFTETAWFLDKIETPEARIITFNYFADTITAKTGTYQTFIKPLNSEYYCSAGDATPSNQYGDNVIVYDTHVLSSITSPGLSVSFNYEQRGDGSGDTRLKQMEVTPTGASVMKRYRFDYITPVNYNTSQNKRFFLKAVKEFEIGSYPEIDLPNSPDAGNWLYHEFQYLDIENMIPRLSAAQDWWGYGNGNTGTLAPYIASIAPFVMDGSSGGNRSAGTQTQMQKGLLWKITYPTGGSEEFAYEPHTLVQNVTTPTFSEVSPGGGGIGVHDPWTHTSANFTATSNQTIPINLICRQSPSFPTGPSGEGDYIYQVNLKKVSTGEVIFTRKFRYYTEESFPVTLVNGTAYKLEVTIWGELNAGSAILKYNYSSTSYFENKIVGGLRVRSIASYDPFANKTNTKYYTYTAFSDLTKSSGVGPLQTINYGPYVMGRLCTPSGFVPYTDTVVSWMISSNSLTPYYTFGGSNVGYTNVIESDDVAFANGFTEHFFSTSYPGTSVYNINVGESFLGTPSSTNSDRNGMEEKTRFYLKKPTGEFVIVKQIDNEISGNADDGFVKTRKSYIVRKRFEWDPHWNPPSAIEFRGFDLVNYDFTCLWFRNISTTETQWDKDGLNPIVSRADYEYSPTLTHLQPIKVFTTGSDGIAQRVENKYPVDVANPFGNVYQSMVIRNRVQDVIESKNFTNNVEMFAKYTEYTDYFSNGIGYPNLVKTKTKAAANWDNRMNFTSYDSKGNPLQLSKDADVLHSFIWDYYSNRPVAEVVNAPQTDIAYTSFEADAKGNWTFAGLPTSVSSPNVAVTGTKVYNPSAGSLTRTIVTAGDYIVSYWSKTGTRTVNSTSGTAGRIAMGWTIYTHSLTLAANATVTVSGTGDIDELRLYPKKASMTSMTYLPFVGISSQCDARNIIIYYSYDGYNRLLRVRDMDNNILKQFDYQYSRTPVWTATGTTRCKTAPPNNFNTGEQEKEERDLNTSSPTYNQTRWVSLGINLTACPAAVTITATNTVAVSGFKATYTNVATSQVYEFTIPSTAGPNTLGQIPAGTYNLTFSKVGNTNVYAFYTGCGTQGATGQSKTFYNIVVTGSNCNAISIGDAS